MHLGTTTKGERFFLPFCAAGARTDRFSLPNPLKFSADEISLGIFFSLSGYPSSHTYLYNLTRLGKGGRAKKQEKVSLARKGKKRKSFSLYFPPSTPSFSPSFHFRKSPGKKKSPADRNGGGNQLRAKYFCTLFFVWFQFPSAFASQSLAASGEKMRMKVFFLSTVAQKILLKQF